MIYNVDVTDVRDVFAFLLQHGVFVQDKSGVKCLEIENASFIANEPTIFGAPNEYIDRELVWYKSQSLNVNDIPAPVPQIWKNVATKEGLINSNYGWCIWSKENGSQYSSCLKQLITNRDSRRAVMIYTRPSMQTDYNKDGMSDFMCTSNVQYMIRNNKLHSYVYMRSNDSVMGYKNDWAWQNHVLEELLADLKFTYPHLQKGDMIWNACSLHVYEPHFYLVDHFANTSATTITKKEYAETYPDSRLSV